MTLLFILIFPGVAELFSAAFPMAAPPVAPVPATEEVVALLPPLLNSLPIRLAVGVTNTLANQGVAHTLKINRRGSSALVTAYAVASLECCRASAIILQAV